MKRFIPILLSLAIPSWGAIAVNSQESAGAGHKSAASPLTWSFTNTAGTKLVCGFVVTNLSANAAVTMSTPTYNGATMTNVSSQFSWKVDTPGRNTTAIYYLDSPATGSNTVSIAWTTAGALDALGGCVSFTGMNTGAGTVTTGLGTSGTTATASNITTASGNYIFATGGWGSGEGGAAGSGFTRTYVINGSGSTAGDDNIGEYQSSAGSAITPTFTWGVSDSWGIIAAEFTAAAGAGGATVCPSMNLLGVGCGF